MSAPFASEPTLSGWQMAPSLQRVIRFGPSHLLFSPLSWPCSPHCQPPSQVQMLALHRRSAEGTKQTGQQEAKEEKLVKGGETR